MRQELERFCNDAPYKATDWCVDYASSECPGTCHHARIMKSERGNVPDIIFDKRLMPVIEPLEEELKRQGISFGYE